MIDFPPTPLCDKLAEARPQSDAVMEFFEWLSAQGYLLSTWGDGDELLPVNKRVESLFLEYLGIDWKALDDERRAMLEAHRRLAE